MRDRACFGANPKKAFTAIAFLGASLVAIESALLMSACV